VVAELFQSAELCARVDQSARACEAPTRPVSGDGIIKSWSRRRVGSEHANRKTRSLLESSLYLEIPRNCIPGNNLAKVVHSVPTSPC